MAKESFLLVSLKEDKAKRLAQVVSNESCRKILDYLTSKEATETELAKKLNLPISTVHYNLKHLQDAGLVVADEFHYSKKGREVNHYKLANKYIIIAPKTTFGIKEKLKSILPAVLVVGAASLVIQLAGMISGRTASFGMADMAEMTKDAAPMASEAAESVSTLVPTAVPTAVPTGAEMASTAVEAGAFESGAVEAGVETIAEAAALAPPPTSAGLSTIAFWVLVAGIAAIGVYVLIDYLRNRE